jgi:hypothetical protein
MSRGLVPPALHSRLDVTQYVPIQILGLDFNLIGLNEKACATVSDDFQVAPTNGGTPLVAFPGRVAPSPERSAMAPTPSEGKAVFK